MAAEVVKSFERGSVEEKQFWQAVEGDYTQVHLDVAEALENIMKDRKHEDTWLDVVDKLVIDLSAKVSFVAKNEYDDLVTDLRKLTAKP